MPTNARVQIVYSARAGRELLPYLRRHLPGAIARTGSKLRELSVVVVGDKQIGELHARFFGDPSTTDVITFPLDLDARGKALTGELYLCAPMARRQASLRNIKPEQELLLYALHGVLHLNGHDDRTESGYRKMHYLEDRILRVIGIGATFAPNAKQVKAAR